MAWSRRANAVPPLRAGRKSRVCSRTACLAPMSGSFGTLRLSRSDYGPFRDRRHRGQDRVDIAAGPQSEDRAAVVQEIELDIASAPHQFAPRVRLRSTHWPEIPAHELGIDLQKGAPRHSCVKARNPRPSRRCHASRRRCRRCRASPARCLRREIVVAPLLVLVVGRDGPRHGCRRLCAWRRGTRWCRGRPGCGAGRAPA